MGDPHQHYLDTSVEVWLRGGNPDRVDVDRCYEDFYAGRGPDESAAAHMAALERERAARRAEEERWERWEQERQEAEEWERERWESEQDGEE